MRYLIVLFSVLFMSMHDIHAQKLAGHVVDKETGESLAYVNIGVVELGIGTVSDKYGNFSLKVNKGKADSVLFSSIGYEQRKISVEYLLNNPEVDLSPKSYELQTFDVTGKTRGRDRTYGEKGWLLRGPINLAHNRPGDEIGAHIKIRRTTYLKSANFIIESISGDSMIFRVNMYEFKGGKLGENLLKENIIINRDQIEGVVTVDLKPYQLIVDQDVLLTLENIKVDENKVPENINRKAIHFRYVPATFGSGNIYGRYNENSKNVNGEFSKLIDDAELCFYFVGRRLN